MGFIDDFAHAVETYPDDYVTLEIIEVNVPGTALNVSERGSFQVRVRNTGPLNMEDLTLRIRGLNGTLVKDTGALAPFVTEFVSDPGQFPRIRGHNGDAPEDNTGAFSFEVASSPRPVADLFEVSIEGWTALLDHILASHSRSAPDVKATYRDRVRAA
jgi:hypothetical protein